MLPAKAGTCVYNARLHVATGILDSPFCLSAHHCDNMPDQSDTDRQCNINSTKVVLSWPGGMSV